MTLYDVLEVRTDASPADIRAAFRELAMENHPDRGGSAKRMAEITQAYAVLRDPDARADYDHQLAYGRRSPPRPQRNERAAPRPDDLRPFRRPEPGRPSPFERMMANIADAVLREMDRTAVEVLASRAAGRPVTLAEILAATEDPAATRRPPRGRGTGRGR